MLKGTITGPDQAAFQRFERDMVDRMQRAALTATDRAARMAVTDIRSAFGSARLGKLGRVIGATSDKQKGDRVHRLGGFGFSASGVVHARTRSERALGALESYTQGSDIRPKRGGWLWFATDAIPARVGRYRMTPAHYRASGLVNRIGPLVEIPGRHAGERLLIVQRVTSGTGKKVTYRALPASGKLRKGRTLHESVVAFIGIKATSRRARVNPTAIVEKVLARLPGMIGDELNRSR